MKLFMALAVLFWLAGSAVAQPKTNAPEQGLDIQGLADLVNQIDPDRVRDFLTKMQQAFDGTNISDLGSMKAVVTQMLPVLNQFDETRPYATWLTAHLDEFETADEMRRATNAPSLKLQRRIWVRRLHDRPWPPLARTYVPKLKEIFRAEQMPPALVWLAEVESGFDPEARSPAGAAGMFQLMPATARTENLSLWPFDERYQPEKSAEAAARYLRFLYGHYGDWPLAVAAYNVGQGRLDKLLKEHDAHSFDAVARWLPAETQMYVPKVEAVVRLREGLPLAELRMPKS